MRAILGTSAATAERSRTETLKAAESSAEDGSCGCGAAIGVPFLNENDIVRLMVSHTTVQE
ncbi:hypothetical protein GCM10009677_57320 [Sphaerisporangium rubeum]